MKFYDKQGAYSYKDIVHIKQLLLWLSKANRVTCGGWTSTAQYIYDNKIEYDIQKAKIANKDFLIIASRWLSNKDKCLSLNGIRSGMLDRKPNDWLIRTYLVKLGFYKIHDEYADSYY